MGYYISIVDSTMVIPKKNLDKAYQRLCDLNKQDHLKRGGSWSKMKRTASWFSWMPQDYPKECPDTERIFQALGFQTNINSNGDLSIIGYDSKAGQEDLFLETISDLAKGYIIWTGENAEYWKNIFGKKKVKTLTGKIVFK